MAKSFTYNGREYNFSRVLINFTEVKKYLPDALATTAQNFFKDSFRRQGWRDKSLKKWASRKKADSGRAILVRRGHLRNSIRKILARWERIEVGTTLPYALVHNEGFSGTVSVKQHTRRRLAQVREKYTTKAGKSRTRMVKQETGRHTVKAHSRKVNIPQRQYIGDSEALNQKIDKVFDIAIDNIFDV